MVLRYCIALLFSVSVFSLTIDNFDGEATVSSGPFQLEKASFDHSSAIGGKRKFAVQGLTGSSILRTRLSTSLGFMSHSQDTGASGISVMSWDATSDLNNLLTTGLPNVDFTQDGSTAIKLDVLSFDYPNQHSVELKIFLYSTDGGVSKASLVLNNAISAKTSFEVPFASFVANASKAADFTKIGAVSLEVWGLNDDIDLRLEWFGTNSPCTLIPNSLGRVVDECGVCGGDNSSCSDCLGVPWGTAKPGTSCNNGELGVCAGGTFNNSCGCVRNVEPSADICDALDNDCDGSVDEDFSQKNTACSIGTGLCSLNGVFQCNPTGGIMCSVDAQKPQVDLCESSKGCDGVPNSGLVFNACNVCGGNNSTCSDCKGIPNGTAVVDRCGLCNGDGLSCLACTETDQSSLLVKLDGLAKAQENVVKKSTAALVRFGGTKFKAYAAKINAQAYKTQDASWNLVWQQLPRVSKICGNKQYCQTVSNVSVIEKYNTNSEFLKKLTQDVLRRLAKYKKAKNTVSVYSKAANSYHAKNITLTNEVPLSQSSCS